MGIRSHAHYLFVHDSIPSPSSLVLLSVVNDNAAPALA